MRCGNVPCGSSTEQLGRGWVLKPRLSGIRSHQHGGSLGGGGGGQGLEDPVLALLKTDWALSLDT